MSTTCTQFNMLLFELNIIQFLKSSNATSRLSTRPQSINNQFDIKDQKHR